MKFSFWDIEAKYGWTCIRIDYEETLDCEILVGSLDEVLETLSIRNRELTDRTCWTLATDTTPQTLTEIGEIIS